eukprot:gene31431-40825_t
MLLYDKYLICVHLSQEKLFLRAAKYGRVDEMEILLNQGVNIECNQFGRTALHEAARWGQVATVNLEGPTKHNKGLTAFHVAVDNHYSPPPS